MAACWARENSRGGGVMGEGTPRDLVMELGMSQMLEA